MNPEFLVDGVLRSVLGGRRKRSGGALRYLTRDMTRGVGHVARDATRFATGMNRGSGGFFSRPSTLLGALGIAWGIFETLNQEPGSPAGSSGTGGTASAAGGGWTPAQGATPPIPGAA